MTRRPEWLWDGAVMLLHMLDDTAIREAFEEPDVEATVLLADEVGYDVDRIEQNRGSYRVFLDREIRQNDAQHLLEDAFGDGVFAVRTGTEQAVNDDDAMQQTVSFRYRD